MGGKENNLLCLLRDFKIRGAGGEGDVLCELMFISASRSRYPLNTRNGIRAVDRNSDLLIDEYAKKAREVNWEYGGTPMPPLQPRDSRLEELQHHQESKDGALVPGGMLVSMSMNLFNKWQVPGWKSPTTRLTFLGHQSQ